MDKETFGKLFARALEKYNFKNYGSTLYYLDLNDAVIVLTQTIHNGGAEMYLNLIIKECHPEIVKITKKTLSDKMLIDIYTSNKLLYSTPNGYSWNFFNIEADVFDDTIDRFYNESLKPFEISYLNGIEQFNELYNEIFYGQQIRLYKDSAEIIGHLELASDKGHDWFLSDYYYLVHKYNIDSRFVNSNTEKYIIDNVIKNAPEGLKSKEITKWCNKRCKELFISKKLKRDFGVQITFPFIDGKPLKFCGTDIKDGKSVEVYINEDTGELYHCRRDIFDSQDMKYKLWKVE